MLLTLIFQCHLELVERQFREPVTRGEGRKSEKPGNRRRSSDLTEFKRPSDYRRLALRIQKAKAKSGERLLSHQTSIESLGDKPSDSEVDREEESFTPCKDALKGDIQKIIWSLERTTSHIVQDVSVTNVSIPDLVDVPDEVVLRDHILMKALEQIILSWETHIMKTIDEHKAKVWKEFSGQIKASNDFFLEADWKGTTCGI